ncbi:MAG: mechanosensitive ion channel protein MscS [Sphingomonadales bacterium 35-56-22]|jgi:small-conductance mechanosensitive channel|uniref:mechanosensitive ion channel family protein n=1 Tax=Sphingorhabdus sp. TaxID=1902408 RepID=UPI000BC394F7|nr:mechanosensitive ion channel domain-containing protein [Sphingorhabdus sp.]OYY15812.1 MAG: mechanosensitive ion channel protein MscS [Sphingomonadales bacterium 35-56-22]OYY97800.1 MAG: mechanosensitive ion channel protein MscS [Sphingomonadales bacterium 28-56-43]OYZ61356.1 MAG: mechanosensitive ion channel protein MscS [Sphingomonadales bacterium 24-56-14]OZA82721.1 MAG: mechanosensitive ion channel protein MscS [Sphingomonadales bacterium 39-57-19]HQS12924.1 mechanosensitive ion channel 
MTAKSAPVIQRIQPDAVIPRFQYYWDATVTWVQGNVFELSVAIGMAIIVFAALSWLKRIASKIARESEHRAHVKSIVARTLARTSKFFRVMVSIELVNQIANAPAALAHAIDILFTIAIVVQVAIWLREIILGMIERRAGEGLHEHETLQSAMVLIRLLVSFALFAVAAIVILDNLGVNVTGLVAGLGVGGIAIGLAAQGIFSDLFAAISIIFDKPFRRGDTVSYDNTVARVEVIGMKSTRLRALTGEEKIISNSKLLEKEITNNTLTLYRRVTFVLTLVYQTPPALAKRIPEILREVVEDNGAQFIRAGFNNFAASSLDFHLVFDIESDDVEVMFRARHDIGIAIIDRFAREGIFFAYPTQTTFTAAPDGHMVMPYAPPAPAPKA